MSDFVKVFSEKYQAAEMFGGFDFVLKNLLIMVR